MPKQTFLNLSTEKQHNLLKAAKQEFSRVPLHEAVISNIIKSAQISRGSFYQYFEDLEDLFFYLLEEHVKKNREQFIVHLRQNKGDLINTFIDVFQSMLKDFQDENHRIFFRNAFLNMNHKVSNAFTNNTSLENLVNQRTDFLSIIDTAKLNIKDERELLHTMKIIQAITFQNLVQSFAMQLSTEEAIENYTLEMSMIKKGLYY